MRKLLALLAALLIGAPAFGQTVSYNPPWTAGHLPYIVTNGVLGDGGTAADSPIRTIGSTGPICSNSARQSSGAWNALCLQAFTNAPAVISLQNFGATSPQGLNFNINGSIVSLPTGGGTFIFGSPPFTTGDVPNFLNSSGVLADSGLAINNGVVTSGTWQGTPVAIGFGGTGATSQGQAQNNLGLGSMAIQNANNVAITGGTITGLPTPVNATDAAIKSYVDATSTGLNILAPSTLATTTVLPNTPTYSNGTAGVGASLTSSTNTTLTVDSVVASLNNVVLVKNQAAPAQNGIYTVTTAGSGAAQWVLTRATYFDQAAEMKVGSYTFITSGTVNTNSAYTLSSIVNTVGTDALNFTLFNQTAGGTVSSVATGTGLTGGPITSTGTISLASIGSNTLLMNTTGGSAAPSSTTPTLLLDTFGTSEGAILYRGSSAWTALPPGTSGQVLQTQGAGAIPQWATVGAVSSVTIAAGTGIGVGGTCTITASGTCTISNTGVTSVATGTGLTGGPVTSTGTVSLVVPVTTANGGTGVASPTAHTIPINEGSSAQANTGTGTLGQALISQGAADPVYKSGTRVLLNTLVASNTTTVGDTTSFTSAYNEYELVFENVIPATINTSCEIQVHSGGVFQTTSYVGTETRANSSSSSTGSTTTYIPCMGTNFAYNGAPGISGRVTVFNPSGTTMPKQWSGTMIGAFNPSSVISMTDFFGGWWAGGNGAVDGFQVLFSSGNITSGTIKIYGML